MKSCSTHPKITSKNLNSGHGYPKPPPRGSTASSSPNPPRNSTNEAAKTFATSTLNQRNARTFAATHNRMDRHHPCLLRPSAQNGKFLPRLGLRHWVMKERVSSDHLPPTSPTNTTKRARPRSPMNHCTISVCCSKLTTSKGFGRATSMLRTKMLIVTRAPPSRQNS